MIVITGPAGHTGRSVPEDLKDRLRLVARDLYGIPGLR
jgi:hypothetical protein